MTGTAGAATTAPPVAAEPRTDPAPRRPGRPGAVGAGLVYLALAVALWWGVWSSHPTGVTTCGCGDAARFLWFFAWPPFALTHGHDILYSQFLFHPTGINLLNDTSVVALGVVLAPVTWAFGPVAAMNVALTLSPALSALAMFVLLRRWVGWTPAALVGGLAYGFSPFLVTELAYNQLNFTFLVVPPLVVLALDELLVRQRRSAVRAGVALALLLAVEFFLSTEVLVLTVVTGVVGVALVAGHAAVAAPDRLRARAGHAARGLAVATLVTAAVLAWPVWFLLEGPAHLTGPIWGTGGLAQYGTTLGVLVHAPGSGTLAAQLRQFGGYQGPPLPGLGYLGAGIVVLAVAGVVAWRRDRRLWLFGAVAVVAVVLSLGPGHGYWVPWAWIEHVPWVGNVVEVRFTLVTSLCLAVLVGLVVDHLHTWAAGRPSPVGWARGAVAALAAAVLALVPSVVALAPNLPLTTRAVVLPRWFATVGASLPPGQVVLSYPAPFVVQSPMAWQAVVTLRYAQAGGGGPEALARRAGAARAGFEVLDDASSALSLHPLPTGTPAQVAAVRRALVAWGVTTVVVPAQPGLPVYARGRDPAVAVGLFTAALGEAPRFDHSAFVWSSVERAGPAAPVPVDRFARCTTGVAGTPAALGTVAPCLLGTGS